MATENLPEVVSRDEWLAARKELLAREKELTRQRDEVNAARRRPYSSFGRGIEEFHNGDPYLDLTALGRQEPWEEPKGRAASLGLQVSGPRTRLPDEYEDS